MLAVLILIYAGMHSVSALRSFYFFQRIERLEQLRPLAAGYAMGVAAVSELPIGGVDTEEDLARANARWLELSAERA